MSTKKNKSGVYVRNNIIYVQGVINGIFYRKSSGKKATKTNMTWVKKNADDVLYNLVVKKKESTSSDTIATYGLQCLKSNAQYRENHTNDKYMSIFNQHILPHFGNWKLSEINPENIKDWQSRLHRIGLSSKRIRDIRGVFTGFMKEACINKYIDSNPFDNVKCLEIINPDIKPLSLEEIELVIQYSNGWFRNYLIISIFTGLRVGEMIGLKWEDVNFEENYISISRAISKGLIGKPKTKHSYRDVDILPSVKEALKEQFCLTGMRNSFIFLTQYKTNYNTAQSISKDKWKPLLKNCGLADRRLYETRHTFASIMLQQKEEIGWVSQMLGHADINITLQRYVKFIPRPKHKRAIFLNNLILDKKEKTAQKLHTQVA